MTTLQRQAKAVVGGLVAGLTALATALADGQVTQLEWTGVVLAALVAYGAVYRVPNRGTLSVHLSSAELLELARAAQERERR